MAMLSITASQHLVATLTLPRWHSPHPPLMKRPSSCSPLRTWMTISGWTTLQATRSTTVGVNWLTKILGFNNNGRKAAGLRRILSPSGCIRRRLDDFFRSQDRFMWRVTDVLDFQCYILQYKFTYALKNSSFLSAQNSLRNFNVFHVFKFLTQSHSPKLISCKHQIRQTPSLDSLFQA